MNKHTQVSWDWNEIKNRSPEGERKREKDRKANERALAPREEKKRPRTKMYVKFNGRVIAAPERYVELRHNPETTYNKSVPGYTQLSTVKQGHMVQANEHGWFSRLYMPMHTNTQIYVQIVLYFLFTQVYWFYERQSNTFCFRTFDSDTPDSIAKQPRTFHAAEHAKTVLSAIIAALTQYARPFC